MSSPQKKLPSSYCTTPLRWQSRGLFRNIQLRSGKCGAEHTARTRPATYPLAMDTTETVTVNIQGVLSETDAVLVEQQQRHKFMADYEACVAELNHCVCPFQSADQLHP